MTDDDLTGAPGPRPRRRKKRKSRRELRAQQALRPCEAGGVTAPCGCRFVYAGGRWQHITPHRGHRLRTGPISDTEMKVLAA